MEETVLETQEDGNYPEKSENAKSETKFKLEHNRPECIGCSACEAVAPKFWIMSDDGKSDIIDSKMREDGWEELDIKQRSYDENLEAAENCPVNVIHITDQETGKKII